jgi:hypothetical protein
MAKPSGCNIEFREHPIKLLLNHGGMAGTHHRFCLLDDL